MIFLTSLMEIERQGHMLLTEEMSNFLADIVLQGLGQLSLPMLRDLSHTQMFLETKTKTKNKTKNECHMLMIRFIKCHHLFHIRF